MLFNFSKRQELAKHPIFKDTKQFWETSNLNTYMNSGNINYLLASAHRRPVMTRSEWGRYYNDSGNLRKEKLEKTRRNSSLDLYFGRTINDILEIAIAFKNDLKERGFNQADQIPDDIIFNMTYYRIVDVAYILYVRQLGTIQNLINHGDNRVTYHMPDADMVSAISVSVIVKEKQSGMIIGGIKIRRNDLPLMKTEDDYAADKKSLQLYNFVPQYLRVDIKGNIYDEIPRFDKELRKL